jgi:hypothetical protein
MTKLKNPSPKSSLTRRGAETVAATMIAVDSEEVGACRRSRPDKRQTRMEADVLKVPWVVGLAQTGEGGVRERAAVAVPKPREEGIGRGGPTWLVLRERGGWGSGAHGAEEGPGDRSGTYRVK